MGELRSKDKRGRGKEDTNERSGPDVEGEEVEGDVGSRGGHHFSLLPVDGLHPLAHKLCPTPSLPSVPHHPEENTNTRKDTRKHKREERREKTDQRQSEGRSMEIWEGVYSPARAPGSIPE